MNRVKPPPFDGKFRRVPPGWEPPSLKHDSHGGNLLEDFIYPVGILIVLVIGAVLVALWAGGVL